MTGRVRSRIRSGMTGEGEIPEQVRNDEWVKSSGMIPGGLVDEKFLEFVRENERAMRSRIRSGMTGLRVEPAMTNGARNDEGNPR